MVVLFSHLLVMELSLVFMYISQLMHGIVGSSFVICFHVVHMGQLFCVLSVFGWKCLHVVYMDSLPCMVFGICFSCADDGCVVMYQFLCLGMCCVVVFGF